MRYLVTITILLASCAGGTAERGIENETTGQTTGTKAQPSQHPVTKAEKDTVTEPEVKTYENKRFRNVRVQKQAGNSYLVSGEGQIFEASFNWIIEDGHRELDSGYTATDAGAPEWGRFSFTVSAPEHSPNSALHLVLFEISAKDGSRTYELPIPLN